ncbi:hypothetical protein A3G67_03495 [Candidatus Roizmanbacteria bacterium RIFCSPLOWO2_12_FULL_40_12]|uniref:Mn transporter n=1 Tax=Candidatus Roizmanbacteria bacterium RIFCSPLOWO2_01_FULL_40_42 TaxID=1802066 RepID=A0A1F7J5L3_9BACT|nr:MAG: hypothetical protein A2779_03130 [Candidatus Roizmanbacteria bacterium RIFCSPHIGHO2_01_FULL_40_98]OGK28333.1 MAG: hypothetical protein A3C31_00495 [Candidatus Roizmanbacteria bacterium RIFCSPHIGHO2_02_FULL_40_53]OGK30569.1 MAG: hypothetical protein A2W49_03180 [Candidatus Roizmanbacteria bacterium RIFCSPHIGHO2_12_41_18]OGK36983.1 MAG: hypothetical protein A3E69_00755 [Candidatus Roizmanbacteria bacterium RIFCSPHIGHO2_12_FULL_40_130]OGK50889.1 MAG: hypothetical protein A3B50_01265 [Candi
MNKIQLFLQRWKHRLFVFLLVLGPGLITAVADNDAGGVATYTVAAATFGMASQLLIIPTTILLAITQDVGARIAVVTRKGLGDLIREQFGIKISVLVFFIYFVVNQGVVLQNISGLKAAYQLFDLPWPAMLIGTCFLLILLVINFSYKRIQRIFLILIFFYFSYVLAAKLTNPDWIAIAKETLIPQRLGLDYWFTLIAVLGTTITAWGQFFVNSYVNDKKLSIEQLRYERAEIYLGALVTNFFSLMIAVAVSNTLFKSNVVVTSGEQAALALRPLAGDLASALFASGLFGASLLGLTIVPLATAYVFSELFGYEGSLDTNFKKGRLFYTFFSMQIIIALIIALIPSVSLFALTLFVDYLNGAILPLIFFFLIKFSEDKELMGKYILKGFSRFFLRLSAVVVTIAVVVSLVGKIFRLG